MNKRGYFFEYHATMVETPNFGAGCIKNRLLTNKLRLKDSRTNQHLTKNYLLGSYVNTTADINEIFMEINTIFILAP